MAERPSWCVLRPEGSAGFQLRPDLGWRPARRSSSMSPRSVLDGQHTRAACPPVRPRRWALLHLRHGHVHDADPQVTAMFRRRTGDNEASLCQGVILRVVQARRGGPSCMNLSEGRSVGCWVREVTDPKSRLFRM